MAVLCKFTTDYGGSAAACARRATGTWALMLAGVLTACSGSEDDELEASHTMDSGLTDSGQAMEDASTQDGGGPPVGDGDGDRGMDAAQDSATDAGTDAGDPDVIVNGLYVSPTGDDTSNGEQGAPYLTLAKAASMAVAGDTIVLMDGDYDATTQPTFTQFNSQRIDIVDGVTVRALNEGGAVLHGVKGYLLRFLGTGTVRGLVFDGFSTSVFASSGTLTVRETKFLGGGSNSGFPIEVSGTATAIITPPSDGDYIGGTNHHGFLGLRDNAQATITGGRFSGAVSTGVTCNVLFSVPQSAKLTLDNITTEGNAQDAVWATGTSEVLIRNSTLRSTSGICAGTVLLGGTPTLTMENSTISDANASGILVRNNASSRPIIHLTDTTLTRVTFGLYADYTDSITLTALRAHFDDNTRSGLINRGAGSMTFEQSSFDRNDENGLQADVPSSPHVYLVKARGCSFQDNVRNGALVGGDPTSSFDFGKVDEAGDNTLRGNSFGSTSYSNLTSSLPSGFRVYAVGNTWSAAQGATAGQYSVAGDGAFLDQTGITAAGDRTNYYIGVAGSIVRLAENP